MPDTTSYLALYRKLRPLSFKDLIGQDHIVRTLMNQLSSGRVSHAYLICGTRGTGKTSTAKIFARAVNCLALTEGEPCNKCSMCKDILAQRSMNVIEIDAASNNGVDNIRDIREEVRYPPAEGIYKVYIIDEVHMLSTGAFNALLKTLEEPPEHVIFILATTDPQKVPATIHSRCQRFDFKRIKLADMCQATREYANAEQINIEDDAIRYLAAVSDGSMRDALSILDQCISFYMAEPITLKKVLDIVGSVDNQVFFDIIEALRRHDASHCLEIINELSQNGRDAGQFVSELLVHCRNALVAVMVPDETTALDLSADTIGKLRTLGKAVGSETIMAYIHTFSSLANQMKYASNDRILLEIACIRLCNPATQDSYDAILSRLQKLESEISGAVRPAQAAMPTFNADHKSEEAKTTVKKLKKSVPADIRGVRDSWPDFVAGFDNPMKSFLAMATVGYLEDNLLAIVTKDAGSRQFLRSREEQIRARLAEKYNTEYILSILSQEEYESKHRELYGEKDDTLDFDKNIKAKIKMDIEYE